MRMQPRSDSMHSVLQELASQYDKKIRQVQTFDSNVTPYKVTDGYKLDAPPGTVFTRSLKFALQELAEMWGVSDDEDREALIASASRKSLEALYAVSPLFNDINRHLDSTAAEDEPEPTALLGRLAEAATEAGNALRLPPESHWTMDQRDAHVRRE